MARRRQTLAARALAVVIRAAQHLTALAQLVIPRMPRRLFATSTLKTKDARCDLLLLDEAIRHEHIGIRTATFAYAIAVDCDHADWYEPLEELVGHGLPWPTWICADPWTGRAHLVWWLDTPVVLTEKGREAPRRLLDIVNRLLSEALGGDRSYTGHITRNPWRLGRARTRQGCPTTPAIWEAHQAATPRLRHAVSTRPALHTLVVLRRALQVWQDATGTPTPARRRRASSPEYTEPGRRLFDTLRYRVYASWPMSESELQALAAQIASEIGSPIHERQRVGMARRMHRWMCRRYTACWTAGGRSINRGRDQQETIGLAPREARAIAAANTGLHRRERTIAAVQEAAAHLRATGCQITRAALAAKTGLSGRTVQRCWRTACQGG